MKDKESFICRFCGKIGFVGKKAKDFTVFGFFLLSLNPLTVKRHESDSIKYY